MDITYHYPPDLFGLLESVIPKLFKGKEAILLFFRGAGVEQEILTDLQKRIKADRDSISKLEIARTVLRRLNDKGEATLRERREIVKRIVELENYSNCWPQDELAARGLVAQIRNVVNVKDSFTRMKQERDRESSLHREAKQAVLDALQESRKKYAEIRKDLFGLFSLTDASARGKGLERVLNSLFKHAGISVREPFTIRGDKGEGVIEQVDGAIELDGDIYLVEIKWLKDPVGKPDISEHLIRVYHRGFTRGIFISVSQYTEAAILLSKESLQRTVIVLGDLQEIVMILEREIDLRHWLKEKIVAAQLDKNPYKRVDLT